VTPVLTSRYLQTNATVLALPGAGTLVVDSPYFPDELEKLSRRASAGGGPIRLFATHSHYDHVMGRLALPDAPLLAAPSTVAALRREPRRPVEELEHEDARTYVARGRPLQIADAEGTEELDGCELVPAAGHTGDGCALLHAPSGTLCCGDYLSDVEIPLLSWAGSLPAYLATLDRLEALLDRAALVVPGHGSPTDPAGARRRLEQDREYLAGLPHREEGQPLPPGRDSSRQREIHRANIVRHA
jgi:glyoxylase-like metal-dependent hydrolase (beta-lactamase superfamily II)